MKLLIKKNQLCINLNGSIFFKTQAFLQTYKNINLIKGILKPKEAKSKKIKT